MQETGSELKEFVEEDIWGSLQDFLNWGLHLGEGDNSIHVTVGLLLLLTIAIITTNFVLKLLRRLFTRKMDNEDKFKFISIFKFSHGLFFTNHFQEYTSLAIRCQSTEKSKRTWWLVLIFST